MASISEYTVKIPLEDKRQRFVGGEISKNYAKYRLSCNQELIEQIISYLREKIPGKLRRALDVGCGTGQSTRVLGPYFQEILGIDASPTQIEEAKEDPISQTYPHISYKVGFAEELPFEDKSVELVTASESFHWFNRETFMKEVQRILVPNGVLAVCTPGREVFVSDDPRIQTKLQEAESEFWRVRLFVTDPSIYLDPDKMLQRELNFPELRNNKRIEYISRYRVKVQEVADRVRSTSFFGKAFSDDIERADAAVQEFRDMLMAASETTESVEDCFVTVERINWGILGRL